MKLSEEAKVGLMITVSFTVFIVMIAMLAKINISRSGYTLRVYYSFLNDLRVGAPVKIAGGIKIGYVDTIKQSGEKTEVDVWIEKKYPLVKNTRFAIFTSGLIGEKYVNVFVPPSSDVEEFLADGDVVYGLDPASFDQMMMTFQTFMQDESGGQVLAEIFQNSKKFVGNLNKIADENRYDVRQSIITTKEMIASLNMQSQVMMGNINKFSKNMADLSEQNKDDINITLRNLSEVSANLNKIVFRIEKGRGTLGRLLNEEDIYNNLRDASISAKDLFRQLKQDPSKLFFRTAK
ncbi:MAG TPA: MlaD family protein [Spirochaetota bacterium]|nr:MCE family protein [Spirochaetota bacterium]HOD13385.1 MlaD family protein [Spirochaetota bacterium]HPG50571.1 MlaD family protein [Spirochaetota bacterium]HPN11860.1 MlaD family protein [Spirochaetota bacterium]HQL81274.1 MlaD family protein [Spirochaetota bacterium]